MTEYPGSDRPGPGRRVGGPSQIAGTLTRQTGAEVTECRPIGGEHGARHYQARLADGRGVFVKEATDEAGAAALGAEARGLRWLRDAGAARVPDLIYELDGLLVLDWVAHSAADPGAAQRFGRDLAATHKAGSARFGAPLPGFIASLPLPNDESDTWAPWYAEHRILPYCRLARDNGMLHQADVDLIETVADRAGDLAGPAEPPSRIHGDLWSGNVLWSDGQCWLIDPAAHGGHRETDLAMLALFGAPFLDRILAAYRQAAPLADGWRARVPLHQLHPLLVHVCLFGGGYRETTLAAARAALSA